ncbi:MULTISPECIES: excinuclease ABC subunit UvrC [Segatella]|jgi:excinuclease ABC subunit C|uniref:UvrABC system protein C n=2 Tax=Segatella TaxID=2974251 RepID=D8DXN0_9BACT|nr:MULTISPECIES: excinuclease ABC subunit UvrC [Segatella]MEE3414395.1 excinuclease ABC subunit UvrC [Prevotella sp.]EFI71837.1 excinuclease ABC, C subunit [Segatella baroniae B14]UKK77870.1 excinuclease ABC subunit UvrC [Segatella baroniae B14]SEP98367.1 Excinuclease ABC subunit C [Segatella baroniae B14]GJG27857.1 UvrABC system protein C [Segatella bryantii]
MTKEENEKRVTYLKNIVLNMPEKPGSYQFYDSEGTIIYVGKAKKLKSRVSTYFHKEVDRFKTKVLVSKIHNISYTVVNTEEDALLLENSLIKKYNPKYNVLLKDGKTYPSICVTNEYFPRIFKTRTINKKFGTYYGPYPHITSMYAVLDIIKKVYKPRTCRFPITREGVLQGKYKPCLEYHIHNCGAPCINKQSYEDYQENIRQAREILKGNTRKVEEFLYHLMQKNAELLKFEVAEKYKKKYLLLNDFVAKSEVVSHTIDDVDVFTITDDDNHKNAYINYIHVKNGTINQSFTFEYKRKLDETDEELLITAIPDIRQRFHSQAKEIIVPFEMEWKIKNAEFFVPQRGDKHHLLELSEMNGKQYKFDRLKQAEKLNPEQKQTRLMTQLKKALKLDKLPYHIECFDNSNISGSDAVAGCIVYKGMKPSRKDYRKYNIKTVVGPDDYASMQEVVRRRYTRMVEEKTPLPDLIITDGGKGQMDVVRQVIEGELHLNIPIAGLAKNDRHRTNELLYGWPPQVIGIKTDSELFRVLTQIQDEVHRYAITFHRDKRSKHALHSELDDIKGFGPKSKELILKKLKTVKSIKEADIQKLTSILGPSKAEILYHHFHE